MTKEQTYIDFIISELKEGNVNYKDVFALFCAKFRCSKRTFDKYWKKANKAYSELQKSIQKEKEEIYTESELEGENKKILKRIEVLEMTSNISKLIYNKMVKDKEPKSQDVIAFNSTNERLAKMLSFDAPKKVETNGTIVLGVSGQKFAEGKTNESTD